MLSTVCERGFQLGDTFAKRRGARFDLLEGEAWGDVLRAIPIEGLDRNYKAALDSGAIVRDCKLCQRRVIAWVDEFYPPEQFQPGPVRIVHEEQRGPVIIEQVADAHILTIVSASVTDTS